MSDRLNPIFVLSANQYFRFFRSYRYLLLVAALFYYPLSIWFSLYFRWYKEGFELFVPVCNALVYFFAFLFGMMFSTMPNMTVAKRYIDHDSLVYTPLSDVQVSRGFVYAGFLNSAVVCFTGFLLILPFNLILGRIWDAPVAFFDLIAVFLFCNLYNFVSASVFAGIRDSYQLTYTRLILVFFLLPLYGLFLFLSVLLMGGYYAALGEHLFCVPHLYVLACFCGGAAITNYCIESNVPKTTRFKERVLITLAAFLLLFYIILALGGVGLVFATLIAF